MPSSPPLPSTAPPILYRDDGRPRGTARRWLPWLPLVLAVCLYVGASTGPALFDQNEAQYAGAVREMMDRPGDYLPGVHGTLERGHWFIPTNDGIPRLQKPPFVYWMLMASMRTFGGQRVRRAAAQCAGVAAVVRGHFLHRSAARR